MIEPKVLQFERGTAELDRPAIVVDHLIRERSVGVVEHGEAFLRPLVRDNGCARIFEGLAAGDVVVVVMAVDQEFDRLVGNLLDLGDIVLPAGRSAIGDRIGRDHAVFGDDEHRLMIAIAEDVDVVGALDLRGLDLRSLCLLRQGGGGAPRYDQGGRHSCYTNSRHDHSSLLLSDRISAARPARNYSTSLDSVPRAVMSRYSYGRARRNANATKWWADVERRNSTTRPFRTTALRSARLISTS